MNLQRRSAQTLDHGYVSPSTIRPWNHALPLNNHGSYGLCLVCESGVLSIAPSIEPDTSLRGLTRLTIYHLHSELSVRASKKRQHEFSFFLGYKSPLGKKVRVHLVFSSFFEFLRVASHTQTVDAERRSTGAGANDGAYRASAS